MSRFSSLVLLVSSLSKAERRGFSTSFNKSEDLTDYVFLYKLIEKNQNKSEERIKAEFSKARPEATLNTAVNYLFDRMLGILTQMRMNLDSFFLLMNQLMYAKVLFEKSIYKECFKLLEKVQKEANYFENFPVLLIAQKLEQNFLFNLDFPEITEQELLKKQYRTNDTLRKERKINEHASLCELLKYRILNKGTVRSNKQKQEFNDLIVSEMSIVSNSNFENFEIEKNHKLFQSNYLINIGDYKSALNAYYELNNLFEQNKHLLNNPPMYYLMTIEGILESLRTIGKYESMSYFIEQLSKLKSNSSHFAAQTECVVFLYTLFPLIDVGRFGDANLLMKKNKINLYEKRHLLVPARQAQLALYTALTYFGNLDYQKARKTLHRIITVEKNIYNLPIFRTIRLVNLMIWNELNEFDYVEHEVRSIKREVQNNERLYQMEWLVLKLLNKPLNNLSQHERDKLWSKIEPQLIEIRNNKFERQLLRIFDFTAWIESKIRNRPLDYLLSLKQQTSPVNEPLF